MMCLTAATMPSRGTGSRIRGTEAVGGRAASRTISLASVPAPCAGPRLIVGAMAGLRCAGNHATSHEATVGKNDRGFGICIADRRKDGAAYRPATRVRLLWGPTVTGGRQSAPPRRDATRHARHAGLPTPNDTTG